MIGTARLSDYSLETTLGQGGMAAVLRAVYRPTGEVVALKQMLPHIATDEVFVARFVRELEVSSKLRNEHIVQVQGWGRSDDGIWFLALEFCDGGTLVQLLKHVPRLPAAVVVVMLDELLNALQTAHIDGVIHRDIKPPNILLTMAGVSKLSDFGIARSAADETLTATGDVIGTPAYMSPEQALGVRDLDGRSDLFALGMLAYRLLIGFNPFASENVATSILRVTSGPSLHVGEALPTVPILLERTIDGLIEKDRDRRLPSAAAARAVLAPLVEAVHSRYPHVLRRLMHDPQGTSAALLQDAVHDELAQARHHARSAPAKAMVHAARARLHEPDNADVHSLLHSLMTQHGFRLDDAPDPRVAAAVAELESRPDDPVLLRRLANLHRGLQHPLEVARYLKRYLALRPDDALARQQLEELLGAEDVAALTQLSVSPPRPPALSTPDFRRAKATTAAPPSVSPPRPPRLSTQAIMHGVKTGGVKAPGAFATMAPQPLPTSGFGRVAVVKGAANDDLVSTRSKLVFAATGAVAVVAVVAVIGSAVRKGGERFDGSLRAVEHTESAAINGLVAGTQQPFVERARTAARLADWQGVIDAANFGLSADPDFTSVHTPALLLLRAEAWQMLGGTRQALADSRLAHRLAPASSTVAVEAAAREAELEKGERESASSQQKEPKP